MLKKKSFLILILTFVLVLNSVSFTMAATNEDIVYNELSVNGYGYSPKWNEKIKKINSFNTEIQYTLESNSLKGKVVVPFRNKYYTIPFELEQDQDNTELFYGNTNIVIQKKEKSVGLAAEVVNSKINSLSLIIDRDIAYNLGVNISFDEFSNKVKKIKAEKEGQTNEELSSSLNTIDITTTSTDLAIKGEGSSSQLYAHTTMPTLSIGSDGWLATRVYTQKIHYLSHISRVIISGTKNNSAYDLLYVRPSGSSSSSLTLIENVFYYALNYYLSVTFPVNGYNGANTSSSWEHTYNMWEDWNNHIHTSDPWTEDNGIVSNVRLEKMYSGWISGTIDIDVTEYMSATGYFYHSISYEYSN